MNTSKVTLSIIKKRPLIIIFPAIMMLLFIVLNSYNPVVAIIMGFLKTTKGTILESIVSTLQILINPEFMPKLIIIVLGAAILFSLLAGILFSGYLYIVDKALNEKEKTSGEFAAGIKLHFKRIFLVTLRSSLIFILIIIFLLIACVPAIVVSKAVTVNKTELLIAAILVDLLTAGIMFFALMFSRAYLFFWYPSALVNNKKSFSCGKHLVDKHFWKIILKIFIFDIILIAFLYLVFHINIFILQFLLGWFFGTIYLVMFVVYVFNTYKCFSN